MTTRIELEQALRKALPKEAQDQARYLSALLSSVIDESLSPEEFKEELATEPIVEKAFNKLSGKQLLVDKAVISFGEGNQAGDIAVHDIAGNNIINININVNTSNKYTRSNKQPVKEYNKRPSLTVPPENNQSSVRHHNRFSAVVENYDLHSLPGTIWYLVKMGIFPFFGLMCGWYIGYNIITSGGEYTHLDVNILVPFLTAIIGCAIGFLVSLELHSERKRATGVTWWGHFLGMCAVGLVASAQITDSFPGTFWVVGVFGWGAIWFVLLEGYKELK